jgi:hypothetical protein
MEIDPRILAKTVSMRTDALIEAFVSRLKTAGVPLKAGDNSALLGQLENQLPKRLPQSLDRFLSGYSFPSFDVGGISLFGWGPEPNEFFAAASAAKGSLSELLLPAGYIQIGRPDTGDFDAVCIDVNSKAQNREHRIVRADHEEILCNWRVKISGELWPSFRSLVGYVVASADSCVHYDPYDPLSS